MQSVCQPHIPSIASTQLFPSDSSVQKRETPGIFSRMFPPSFTGITSYRVRTRLALSVVLLCSCLLCIYCFFPVFSPVDPETSADATVIDYVDGDPFFLSEQPGKPPL